MYLTPTRYPQDFLLPVKCDANECNNRVGRFQFLVEDQLARGRGIDAIVEEDLKHLRGCCRNTIKLHPISLDTYVEKLPIDMTVNHMSSAGIGTWLNQHNPLVDPNWAPGYHQHTRVVSTSHFNFVGYGLPQPGTAQGVKRKFTPNLAEADAALNYDPLKAEAARRLSSKHVQMLRDLPIN